MLAMLVSEHDAQGRQCLKNKSTKDVLSTEMEAKVYMLQGTRLG